MKEKQGIKVLFLGDISLNDAYTELVDSGVNPFEEISEMTKDYDAVIGNLECLARGENGFNEFKNPRLKTEVRTLNALKKLNLSAVTLATNHYFDNLKSGFEKTISKLSELNIKHVGAGLSREEALAPLILDVKGKKLGVLNYVHEDTNSSVPKTADVFASEFNLSRILKDVADLKPKVDFLVVIPHWGGKCDYGYFPHFEQLGQAKQIIAAGADALVGHHSHTFQAKSEFNKKPVYYSLGNFCFADIETDGATSHVRESGKHGAMVEIIFSDNQITHRAIPIVNNSGEIRLSQKFKSHYRVHQFIFNLMSLLPSLFSLNYYYLKRWEPVFFHAELQGISVAAIAANKLKRILWRK